MSDSEENNWKEEAEAVMADIKDYVDSVSISTKLPSSAKRIFINLTTYEKNEYCIELTGRGFRIAGKRYDTNDLEHGETFETPYSLLDSLSPKYRDSFGKALEDRLKNIKEGRLKNLREEESDDSSS